MDNDNKNEASYCLLDTIQERRSEVLNDMKRRCQNHTCPFQVQQTIIQTSSFKPATNLYK